MGKLRGDERIGRGFFQDTVSGSTQYGFCRINNIEDENFKRKPYGGLNDKGLPKKNGDAQWIAHYIRSRKVCFFGNERENMCKRDADLKGLKRGRARRDSAPARSKSKFNRPRSASAPGTWNDAQNGENAIRRRLTL